MGKPRGVGGSKKKNAGVGVDFKKVKHKVGKKLPRAQNQTDTTFKSHAISLGEQSLAADRGGQAVSARNLTLKELLQQCGHYAERVRRDALAGLADLLTAHPEELRRHATLVMETAAARVADADAGVRSALRDLLRGTLLPALGPAALAPYVPLLMAHVCAAMTHLVEPIRADALAFLELLMAARPDLVASPAFLAPVLHHFGDLLSKGSRGRSIKAGSLASLHGVAAALERFLSGAVAALAALAGGAPSSGSAAAAAAGGEQQEREQRVLAWRRCLWPPAAGGGAAVPQLALAAAAAEGSGSGDGAAAADSADAAQAAAAALLGHLLDCWAEAGPSQLAEAPELMAAQTLTAILRSCELLLRHWGAASLAGGAPGGAGGHASLGAALIKRVAPFFPVRRPAVKAAPAVVDQLVLLNVAAAQLLAHFLPRAAEGTGAAAAAGGGGAGGASGWGQPWVARLLAWFAGVMASGAALPASDDALFDDVPQAESGGSRSAKQRQGGGGGGSRDTLPADVYQSALDGALRVLPLLPPEQRGQLLGAAWQLWQRTGTRSGARTRVLAFWQALLADPAAAFYVPTPGGGPLLRHDEAAAWLGALPRYLFELGSGSPDASRAALQLLLGAARTAPAGSPLAAALGQVQPQLAPLWAVLLPAGKAAAEGAAPRVHTGPLGGLPTDVQELAADLLYHLPSASDQVLRATAVVCLHGGAYPTSTATRLLNVLAAQATAGGADPAPFCGLLLNVLAGASRAGLQQHSWRRHVALVGAGCRAALALGSPAEVGAALLPPLLDCAGSGDAAFSRWAAYGLLQLSTTLAAAAAAAQQAWEPPEAVAAALPQLMLQLQAASQQQAGRPGEAGADQAPTAAETTALCLRLLAVQRDSLLPALLDAVPTSLAAAGSASQLLPAALATLAALVREAALREALVEQQAAVQAALAACGAASQAAGSATQSSREWQERLRQLQATCGAVLGLDLGTA